MGQECTEDTCYQELRHRRSSCHFSRLTDKSQLFQRRRHKEDSNLKESFAHSQLSSDNIPQSVFQKICSHIPNTDSQIYNHAPRFIFFGINQNSVLAPGLTMPYASGSFSGHGEGCDSGFAATPPGANSRFPAQTSQAVSRFSAQTAAPDSKFTEGVCRTSTTTSSTSRPGKDWHGKTLRGALHYWCLSVICLTTCLSWLHLSLLPLGAAASRQTRTCQEVTDECASYGLSCRQSHSNTLMPIQFSCGQLLDGTIDTCSPMCDEALQAIVSLPVKGWFTCDCTGYVFATFGESLCIGIQERLRVCPSYPPPEPEPISTTASYDSEHVGRSPTRAPAPDATSPPKVACADARVRCELKDGCAAALGKVTEVCTPPSCNLDCVKAIDKLESYQESTPLWHCDCSGESGDDLDDNLASSPGPWCSRFEDDFLKICTATEEENLTYGVLGSTPATGSHGQNIRDNAGGRGYPSPRLHRPSLWLSLGVTFTAAILIHVRL